MMNPSFGIEGARLITSARACDDSSAGIIPSTRASMLAASSASRSLDVRVFDAPLAMQLGVLGPYRRIIESRGNRMCVRNQSIFRLQNVSV